jgi:hypothetical protein
MNPSLSFGNFGLRFKAEEERGSHCINVADRINGSACSAGTSQLPFPFAFGEASAR